MARKLLSLVVALAVVLSSMSFAFAAVDPKAISADVTDAKVKRAVEKLVSLGMVEGIDGKYVPDQKLKRSELTKLIVIALGLGPAADAATGSATQFSDVGADHWAAGYITVAAGQGLVQGMGDGTFAPDSEITFAQALTMLVRALGYKDEFLKGSWPGNYLAKASEKNLDEGVTIAPSAAVKRGDFALMMSNTLDAEVIKIGEYEGSTVKYEETEITLAKEKLDLDKAEVRLTATSRLDSTLKNDEVKGKFTKDCADDSDIKYSSKDDDDTDVEFTLDIAETINANLYLGMTANVYVDKDDTIVYIESAGISEEYWDGIDKWVGADDSEDAITLPDVKLRWAGKTITVLGGDDEYETSEPEDYATIYVTEDGTTEQWDSGLYNAFTKKMDYGRFVIEKGKVVFADLYRFENKDDGGYMVKEVDVEDNSFTYYQGDEENTIDVASKYEVAKFYLSTGEEIALKDLKPFDMVYETESEEDSNSVGNFFVFRKTIEGTLTGVVTVNEDTVDKFEIDSKTTTDAGKGITYSYDNNDEIESSTDSGDYEDFVDTKVTLVIDNNKKVRHIYGETVASEAMFGIALKADTGVEKKLKVYTSNDETVTYSFEDEDEIFDSVEAEEVNENKAVRYYSDADAEDEDYTAFANDINDYDDSDSYDGDLYHKIVEFGLTKDGKIAQNTLKVYLVPISVTAETDMAVNGDFGEDTITLGGDSYYAKDATKVFDIQEYNDDSASAYNIATWENFKDKDVTGDDGRAFAIRKVKSGDVSNDISALFLLEEMNGLTLDQKAAYIISTSKNSSGDLMATYKVFGSSDTYKKEVLGGSISANFTKKTESAVILNVTSNGKVQIYDNAYDANHADGDTRNWKTVAGYVYDVNGSKLTIGRSDADEYEVDSDAVIYQKGDVKTKSSIDEGDFVVAIVHNGTIEAIEMFDIEKIVYSGSIATTSDQKAIVIRGEGAGTADNQSGYYTTQSTGAGQMFYDTEGVVIAVAFD